NRGAYFHLCHDHAVPGMVWKGAGQNTECGFVVSLWLVESAQGKRYFTLNDYAFGTTFGGRAGLERLLAGMGYQIIAVIASEAEAMAVKFPKPDIPIGAGPESLPGFSGYDGLDVSQVA